MRNWEISSVLLVLFSIAPLRGDSIDALSILTGPGAKKLRVRGEPGQEYVIQGASDLGPGISWESLQQLMLTHSESEWIDPSSVTLPKRFYRLVRLPHVNQPVTATHFRLLDQNGRSRDLQYISDQRAVVLIFAASNCPEIRDFVPTLEDLRNRFSPQGVVFWLVVSEPQMTRSALAAQAETWGIDWPVLQDAPQLLAHDLAVHHAPEVVCVGTTDRSIFYRGAIDDRVDSTSAPAKSYVADALTQFLSGTAMTFPSTQVNGCELDLTPLSAISYAREIAPLLQKNCIHCHSAGNIAPWQMNSYEVVQDFAPLIKEKIMTGAMPPWHADPAYGHFSNDVSLKPEERLRLVQWIDAGAPRGDGTDPLADLFASQPPAPNYPNTWPVELGQPDFVVTLPPFPVRATGEIPYQYPSVTVNISSNVWLRAAVVLPGNTRVVHHSLVFIGKGFDVLLQGAGLAGYFAGYVPGMKPTEFPAGTAKLLPANSTITFQMHYSPVGSPETDQTRLGLYFSSQPPKAELVTTGIFNIDFVTGSLVIPPYADEVTQEALSPAFERDVLLYELSPHMHYRGSRFQYEALYPDGSTEVLLSVPKYEFHWQTLYRLSEPKRLPAGTRILCRGAFDNSPKNLENPNPAATIRFGEQTDDEMFIGYMNYSEVPN